MANRLQQTIALQTKISPQQIQMIKLLELPTMQLEERIKREIEDNIVLEEDTDAKSEEQNDGVELPEKISVDEYIGKEDDTPSYKARINNFSKDDKQRPVYITEGRSLGESLIEQLRFRSLSEEELVIAAYIVGSIDDDGYLRRELASLSDDLAFTRGMEVSVEELERILHIVQELEPAGIGARSLQECLLLQMQSQRLDTPTKRLAHRIISSHFEAFAKKHYERLMERLRTTEEEFREAIDFIRTTYGIDYAKTQGVNPDDLPNRLLSDKNLVARLDEAYKSEDTYLQATVASAYEIARVVRKGIDDLGITEAHLRFSVNPIALGFQLLMLLILLPLWIFSWWPSMLVYWIPMSIFKAKMKDPMFEGTLLFGSAVLFTIPLFSLITLLVVGLTSCWLSALIYVALFPLIMLFCWKYAQCGKKTLQTLKCLVKPSSVDKLKRMRKDMYAFLNETLDILKKKHK